MNNMPAKLRKTLHNDDFYHSCARAGLRGHVCEGRITWNHALIIAGRQVQEWWAIVPECEKSHGVGRFQDLNDHDPELSLWIALNRAPDARLEELTRLGGMDYLHRRDYLNSKYGAYAPAYESGIIYGEPRYVVRY